MPLTTVTRRSIIDVAGVLGGQFSPGLFAGGHFPDTKFYYDGMVLLCEFDTDVKIDKKVFVTMMENN